MSALKQLEQWYHSQCDGDWEHGDGIEITTLDNPGWAAKINLAETDLEGKPFELIKIKRDENDWLHCFIRDGQFMIACGPLNLEEGLEMFLRWAAS